MASVPSSVTVPDEFRASNCPGAAAVDLQLQSAGGVEGDGAGIECSGGDSGGDGAADSDGARECAVAGEGGGAGDVQVSATGQAALQVQSSGIDLGVSGEVSGGGDEQFSGAGFCEAA